MDSLKLEGTTIRGLVKGRPVNCIVRSVPDGLVLPPGQYLLRPGENNPIYGPFISIESAFGPGGMEQVGIHFKMPPSALKDTPPSAWKLTTPSALKDSPAAIATLVPTKPAYSAILKEVPGFKLPPTRIRDVASSKVDAPAAKFDAPGVKIAPAGKVDAPAVKIEAPSIKFDFVPGQGMTARVIIAVRPIGQNCLVAQAGFSDLVDAVQQAGGVTLIVA